MRQWLMVLIILLYFSPSNGVVNTADSNVALKECLKQKCIRITHPPKCTDTRTMGQTECTFDISTFSQNDVTALFDKLKDLSTWLRCDNSDLSKLDFTKTSIGMLVGTDFPREDYLPTFTIVNNVNLRSIILPKMSDLTPGFFTILNNPRLSRLSIDNIKNRQATERFDSNDDKDKKLREIITRKTEIQKYGECNYQISTPSKTSLTWPEFRWCRTIPHDVILEGDKFKSGSDPAYILNVNGRLTIKNTNIMDLSMLPVYFKSEGGEIMGNKDLCISFDDEIRMKRLGFQMKNNKPLLCRTTCDSGTLNLTIKNLKDCVTLNGGLKLDGIDAATAGADFFKTIRVINGPVVITNAQVTVDFKELKEIKLAEGENSPHISLTNCAHPILFPNLTTLNGTGSSPMVVLDKARIDIFNFLNRTYTGKIRDISRERIFETATASDDFGSSVSALATNMSSTGSSTKAIRGISVTVQPSNAPVGQPDAPKPIDPAQKPVEPNTKVSPAVDTDRGAAKNSNLPSQRDPNNSAVEGKSNVLMVMTIVSLVVFVASSATSIGIIIKYSVM